MGSDWNELSVLWGASFVMIAFVYGFLYLAIPHSLVLSLSGTDQASPHRPRMRCQTPLANIPNHRWPTLLCQTAKWVAVHLVYLVISHSPAEAQAGLRRPLRAS